MNWENIPLLQSTARAGYPSVEIKFGLAENGLFYHDFYTNTIER